MTTETIPAPETEPAPIRERLDDDKFQIEPGAPEELRTLAEKTNNELTRGMINAVLGSIRYGFRNAEEHLSRLIFERKVIPLDAPENPPPYPQDFAFEHLVDVDGPKIPERAVAILRGDFGWPCPESPKAGPIFQAVCEARIMVREKDLVEWLEVRDALKAHEHEAMKLVELVVAKLIPNLEPKHHSPRLAGKLRKDIAPEQNAPIFKRSARALLAINDTHEQTFAALLRCAISAPSEEQREEALIIHSRLISRNLCKS